MDNKRKNQNQNGNGKGEDYENGGHDGGDDVSKNYIFCFNHIYS